MKTESECILGTCVGINKEHSNGLGEDLIERQAVIRKLKKMATQAYIDKLNGSAETVINCCIDVIERQIPSAQPEIVRCKDCKHSRFFDPCFYCYEFGEEINVPENGFCFMAKRRTDEQAVSE